METVLITGAIGGLGQYLTKEYLNMGYEVIGIDYNKIVLEQFEEEVNNDSFKPIFMDITNEVSWKELVEKLKNMNTKIDCLINAAGILELNTIEDTTLELWNRILSVNATGTFLSINKLLTFMDSGSSIVNISSIASFLGSKDRIAYAASKGAVASLTKAASIELAGRSIRVNSVHPAYIQTQMASIAGDYTNRTYKKMGERIPLYNRISTPKEVGDVVIFLNSEKANFMTGAEIVVDGGQSVN